MRINTASKHCYKLRALPHGLSFFKSGCWKVANVFPFRFEMLFFSKIIVLSVFCRFPLGHCQLHRMQRCLVPNIVDANFSTVIKVMSAFSLNVRDSFVIKSNQLTDVLMKQLLMICLILSGGKIFCILQIFTFWLKLKWKILKYLLEIFN